MNGYLDGGRRTLAVVAVAAVLAAGCGSKTFEQVAGTVLDARTGKPVAQAKVVATAPATAAVAGSADAQGRFTLREVSKQARLQVTAANYQAAEVAAASTPLSVRLTPIPVQGVVASKLTNKGLLAILGGTLQRTTTSGTFRVYGVGPGDRLSITAHGYKPASVTIDADRSVKVLLVAEEATRVQQINAWLGAGNLAPVWRYVFLTPAGFGYQPAPPQLKAEVGSQFAGIGRQGLKGFEMRSVTTGGVAADMAVLVAAFDPRVASLPGFGEAFLAGVSRSMGARAQPITLAGGATAAYLAAPGGKAILLQEGSLYAVIVGDDGERLKAFGSAFVRAHE